MAVAESASPDEWLTRDLFALTLMTRNSAIAKGRLVGVLRPTLHKVDNSDTFFSANFLA